jgi:hypothetical protein
MQWIRVFRDERPRLRVTLNLGGITHIAGSDHEKLPITAVNIGKIPVTIGGMARLRISTMPKGRIISLRPANHTHTFPHRLETYADIMGWIDLKDLSDQINFELLDRGVQYRLVGSVKDPTGKIHRSKEYVLYRPKWRDGATKASK